MAFFYSSNQQYLHLNYSINNPNHYPKIYDKLNNLIRLDYSNKDYTLHPKFIEIINNFIIQAHFIDKFIYLLLISIKLF